jgi:hypothetical protein
MRDPKKRRKPTGSIVPVQVVTVGGTTKIKRQPIKFPDSKDEIEKFIIKSFLAAIPPEKLIAPFVNIQPNQENDFDFIDQGAKRPTYIELMEIAPLENVSGSYDEAPSAYNAYSFAEELLAKIVAKSNKYSVSKDTRLVLLTYITDWRFNFSDTVVSLVQYWTLPKQHVFSEIYSYRPKSDCEGIAYRIYPTPLEYWIDFNPDLFRGNVVHNLDSDGIQLISN